MEPQTEPTPTGSRVTGMDAGGEAEQERSLEAFYASAYPGLVRLLTAMSGSRSDAEELAQEAFAALLSRWPRVSRYDSPEAWLRQVAVRSLVSRQRRSRVAQAAQRFLRSDTSVPPPSGDRLDVEASMRALPVPHRTVLVMHHGLGLPLQQIARELDLPLGTVKSRLSRARAAFVADYEKESVRD